jgi:hypothetical protein
MYVQTCKSLSSWIEPLHFFVVRDGPYIAIFILSDKVDSAATDFIRVVRTQFVGKEIVSVKLAEAIPGAHPDISFSVLYDAHDCVLGKAVFCAVVLEKTLWLGQEGCG